MSDPTYHRVFDRIRFRVPCAIRDGGVCHRGFATDVSAEGLFLETNAKLPDGRRVVIDLELDGQTIGLTGAVVQVRKSNRSTASVDSAGIGIKIHSAPEGYYQLIMALESKRE